MLTTPHRWINAKNPALAEWLKHARSILENGNSLDLSTSPSCVNFICLPQSSEEKRKVIQGTCLKLLKIPPDQNMIVLHDPAAPDVRAALARNLARKYFQNVEPLDCKPLMNAARQIDAVNGIERVKVLLRFAGECMTGVRRAEVERAIESALNGGRRGHKLVADIFPAAKRVRESGSRQAMLEFLDLAAGWSGCHTYRREMLWAMRTALQMGINRPDKPLEEFAWEVQNNIRHAGRQFARSSVASILLAKGLEFDHSVIVYGNKMSNKDWYVALTRATRSLRVIAPERRLTSPAPTHQRGCATELISLRLVNADASRLATGQRRAETCDHHRVITVSSGRFPTVINGQNDCIQHQSLFHQYSTSG